MPKEWLVATIAVATLALGSCADTATTGVDTLPPTPSPAQLQAVVVASELTVRTHRVPIGITERGTPVDDAAVHVRAYAAAAADQLRTESDAPFRSEGLEGRGLYVATLDLDVAGQWLAAVSVRRPNGQTAALSVPFRVRTTSAVPMVGQPAPQTRNPTAADVRDVRDIDSGVPPDDMHTISIATAIGEHRPTLVVFATPAFCTSATCGPQVHAVQTLEPLYHDRLSFVHIEIYENFRPDPSKRQLAPAVLEWHLQTEPWVFLIDSHGRIGAEFEGTASADELRPAIDQVLQTA